MSDISNGRRAKQTGLDRIGGNYLMLSIRRFVEGILVHFLQVLVIRLENLEQDIVSRPKFNKYSERRLGYPNGYLSIKTPRIEEFIEYKKQP